MLRSLRPTSITASLDMTPMIDVVFQLLIFFVMTFRLIEPETEFFMKIPKVTGAPEKDPVLLPPLRLRMNAHPDGSTASITLNEEPMVNLSAVSRRLRSLQASTGSLASAEMEIICDERLRYSEAIHALDAVTGIRLNDGSILRLLEKVHFSPPR